jgi:glycine oxidase
MLNFDLVFIGNGIISTVSALKIKSENPNLKIAIIGPSSRLFSASVAAGAMQAVFCEVEETFDKIPRDRDIFEISLEARKGWLELLSHHSLKESITAEDTVMYRREQSTLFEKINFDKACLVASDYGCLEDVSDEMLHKIFQGNLKPSEVIAKKFIGEFAIDSKYFFEQSLILLEKMGVIFISDNVINTKLISSKVEIALEKNEKVKADKVVVAAGTFSTKIMPLDLPIMPIYHAVGSALVLDSAPESYSDLRLVIRTPNRGGAQCGMHIVPRNHSKFYLGAGNYLTNDEPAHRVETIRYLIEICENELYGKSIIYNSKADLLLGSRPKTLDGYPLIGRYEGFPQIFVATGCYRIGLTIAPVIAEEICRWIDNDSPLDILKSCSPNRKPHSYPSLKVAKEYYSESRISNLIEHGLLNPNNSIEIAKKKHELMEIAINFNHSIVKHCNFGKDFVVDPDMYSMLFAPTVK